eukprot:TRINITY_DN3323_c0_g1_i4.p1 TRINITY_DN3323_c0_g1~~TRINITY_DN3323_c0_g1_i4.p1  ORF type:complete len:401 (+),score=107.18 TRINITY_DN3323_c0_g1_i4:34-1203(+)
MGSGVSRSHDDEAAATKQPRLPQLRPPRPRNSRTSLAPPGHTPSGPKPGSAPPRLSATDDVSTRAQSLRSSAAALRQRAEALELAAEEAREEAENAARELKILYDLDRLRDAIVEPHPLLNALAGCVCCAFKSGAAMALYLFDRESGELELWGTDATTPLRPPFVQRVPDYRNLSQWLRRETKPLANEELELYELHEIPPILLGAAKSDINAMFGHVALVIIEMQGTPKGVMLLASPVPLNEGDIQVLKAAESQIDSAIVQAHNIIDFQLSSKELEVIYKLDKIRDRHLALDDMLKACVSEMSDIIPQADLSFVLLYKLERFMWRGLASADVPQEGHDFTLTSYLSQSESSGSKRMLLRELENALEVAAISKENISEELICSILELGKV